MKFHKLFLEVVIVTLIVGLNILFEHNIHSYGYNILLKYSIFAMNNFVYKLSTFPVFS